jgi:hypothetical protein
VLSVLAIMLIALTLCGSVSAANLKTQNVIFVMTDGLRCQEMFGGADTALINKDNGVTDEAACRKAYWRDDVNERRKALMPFVWNVIAAKGQIFGNKELGSNCRVENPYWFSYPGYSETFCGYVDTGVNSNDFKNNPNVSVFEWLAHKPAFKGKVALFGQWAAMPFILNRDRAGFYINSNREPVTQGPISPRQDVLNRLKAEMSGMIDLPDAVTFYSALEYLKTNKPRVFMLSLGWTDEFAHLNKYNDYLNNAHMVDDYVRVLWNTIQSMPQYKGKTTLIFATDHGRGEAGANWRHHGAALPGSNQTWMAYMGPDTPALGERKNAQEVTASRIAATLAKFLGQDYNKAQPKAGKPIADVVK